MWALSIKRRDRRVIREFVIGSAHDPDERELLAPYRFFESVIGTLVRCYRDDLPREADA